MINKLYLTLFSALLAVVLMFGVHYGALASPPVPRKNASEFEIRFMKDMMDHHRLAINEAEVCLEKAISTLLRRRCENIIANRDQQIKMMHSWLQEWYGIDYQPQRSRTSLRKLEKFEGAVFEMKLMDVIIKHNRQVIRVTDKCMERAYHPELLNLCKNIAAAQTAQIERMQSWLCDWWLVCRKYQ